MASATYGMQRSEKRRQRPPAYDPLKDRAKEVADILWERAMAIAKVLAPDVPNDVEEIDPFDQWLLLETVASKLSPAYWDSPAAITDLYKLRQQFAPHLAQDWLPAAAKFRKQEQAGLPDPAITPENPEFAKNQRRLAR